jgi:hypothetical protein
MLLMGLVELVLLSNSKKKFLHITTTPTNKYVEYKNPAFVTCGTKGGVAG